MKSILSYPGWFPVSVIITHPTARSFGLQLPSPIMALAATEAYQPEWQDQKGEGKEREKSALLRRLEGLEAHGLRIRENIPSHPGLIRGAPKISLIGAPLNSSYQETGKYGIQYVWSISIPESGSFDKFIQIISQHNKDQCCILCIKVSLAFLLLIFYTFID